MLVDENEIIPYKVGGLLYTPATNRTIVDKLKNHTIDCLTSIVFCLEDSIGDSELPEAESNLREVLTALKGTENLPLMFIRVRTPSHLAHLWEYLDGNLENVTGFVLPKFDRGNIDDYFEIVRYINEKTVNPKYIMPIIESRAVAKSCNRLAELEKLKKQMDSMKKYILNVRVGGNDFLNIYGLRRNVTQNIYQIGMVRNILVDIAGVFSGDYVVSGPVWEYFDNGADDRWKDGLMKELELDRLNGFIGKTAIHPSQLPLIWDSLRPTKSDFEDAKAVIRWSDRGGVKGSTDGRMNEVKTHRNWARTTYILGEIYGVKEDL
ncbi:MAG: HpcH/HpaI aldolase/citrate lyase family protein [Ruminococcus flavefaciens]|nr:HpcH/HpaI aldolase/citrate lyase family protein [Ruminococcus flavefaciens]MCM1231071.1 HpcH/HpaI aldolase/citrate lyase family protein [Ruminococcus flavefaciens]